MYVQNMGENFVMKEMKGAFGINIIPDEIFIKTKLSQNRNKKPRSYYRKSSEFR